MKNGVNGHTSEDDVRQFPVHFVNGELFIEVTLHFEPDGKYITGLCPELGITAFGDDYGEAVAALVEAVALQLEAQEDAGELKDFLDRNGVTLQTSKRPHWNPVSPQLTPA